MKYLFIAEKPSLMRDVQSCYRNHTVEIKQVVGSIDFVALAGHACRNAEPNDYELWNDKWENVSYPMLPDTWKIKPIKDKVSILTKIKQMAPNYDGIIVGTDSDTEGYGIYYLVEQYLGLQNMKALRFMEHSLTDKEILHSLLTMTDYHTDPVHVRYTQSFLLRSKADWLYGMNATRLASVNTGKLLTIGRVKAPTLKLVYDNSMSIENFKPETYYQIQADYGSFKAIMVDKEGKAVVNNLPLGSYYLKETVAGDHFVLNPEQKEFTLTAEDDTQAVVYEGVAYKNERQKISISVEKKDAVTEEKLEGVIFGLYAKEDILSQQGAVLVEKDTLLEKKATDEKGQLTFDSDLYHGKYYVKEEVRKPGYLPNEEIWEIDASYTDQNLAEIKLTKEVENQPTESQFTKTDATTGEELEGAKLQIIDQDGNIVEEWISTKEPHVVYGLPEGTYTLHEELPPYAEGYVSAEDIEFEVKEDGSVTKVEMKDTYSKVEISKTDLTTGKELEGAKLQILNKDGEVLEEWVTEGKPHLVEKLPVGEELILREITAPEGYEIAEDVKFTLKDTMEVQKVEMKDARTPETPGVPQTGDDHWKPIFLFALLGVSAAGLMATMLYKKRHKKADEAKKEE